MQTRRDVLQALLKRVLAAAAGFAAVAAPGEDVATSATFAGIRLDTRRGPLVVSTAGELSALAARPVTYRAGETVTATAPDGTSATLVADAAADGGAVFSPTAAGLWTLSNSNGASALVGIAWSVFGAAWSVASPPASPVVLDTAGPGPDRRVRDPGPFPGIAFTGDGWARASAAASTLALTAPDGTATSSALAGTGTVPFAPSVPGVWTAALSWGSTTLSASIEVLAVGTVMIVR